jgi:hypothetical protein
MKTSPISAAFLVTLTLLCVSTFAAGQQLQRSMVYHAAPQPYVAQPSAAKQVPVIKQTQSDIQRPDSSQVSAVKKTRSPIIGDFSPTPHNIALHVAAPRHAATTVAAAPPAPPTAETEATTKVEAVTKIEAATISTLAEVEITAKVEAPEIETPKVEPSNALRLVALQVEASPFRRMENKHPRAFGKSFDKWFYISSAVFLAGAVMDHTSTMAGMKKAGAREANPLLRNSDGSFSPAKHLALTAGIYGASLMLQKKCTAALTAITNLARVSEPKLFKRERAFQMHALFLFAKFLLEAIANMRYLCDATCELCVPVVIKPLFTTETQSSHIASTET